MDNFRNNASAYVSTGYSAGATSIVVEAGFGSRFPTPPFNAIWWNYEDYPDPDFDPDREIVRVTDISTDTLTITREQEGTAATAKNIADKTYRIMAPLTAKTLNTDIPALVGGSILPIDLSDSGEATGILAAGRFPALTGDITTSAGSLATAIGASKVLTAMVADANVTLAKLVNISTSRVLGRTTAGSGVVEELSSLPWAIDLSGSAATGILASARFPALSGDISNSAGSTAILIGAAAVSLSKMAVMATDSILGRATAGIGSPEVLTALPWAFTGDVTSTADSNFLTIGANKITTAMLQDSSVTADKLDASTVVPAIRDAIVPINMNGEVFGTMLAAQFPALTGDITTSAGSLATDIGANKVLTAMILNSQVTLAKMANIATDSIIGRATAATGVPEVLTALPWAFTGDVTSVADANALTIAAAAVTLAKMANMATDSIIGRTTAATGVPEILTTLPWAATGDVTRPADSNVYTLANDAVTYVKMQNVSAISKLIGRGSAAGAGDPEEITLGSGLTMTGTTLSAASGAAGSDTQVQFNDGGTALGGDAGFVYAKTTDLLSMLGSPGANTAPVFGVEARNANAATSGNQQYSGGVFWEGQGWKTNVTAASQSVRFASYVVPVQAAAAPSGTWTLASSINGGAFGTALTYTSAGTLGITTLSVGVGSATITSIGVGTFSSVVIGASGTFTWTGRSGLYSTADGLVQARNSANSSSAAIVAGMMVSAKTANHPVTVYECRFAFTNEGASAKPIFTLPSAAANLSYTFYVQDADGLTVTAAAGDTIRLAGTVSATAGTADSTTVGSSICLVAINATEWVALYSTGSWTIT